MVLAAREAPAWSAEKAGDAVTFSEVQVYIAQRAGLLDVIPRTDGVTLWFRDGHGLLMTLGARPEDATYTQLDPLGGRCPPPRGIGA